MAGSLEVCTVPLDSIGRAHSQPCAVVIIQTNQHNLCQCQSNNYIAPKVEGQIRGVSPGVWHFVSCFQAYGGMMVSSFFTLHGSIYLNSWKYWKVKSSFQLPSQRIVLRCVRLSSVVTRGFQAYRNTLCYNGRNSAGTCALCIFATSAEFPPFKNC